MVSNRLIVLSSGEWVLPYWRDNLVWAATKWPDSLAHCRTKVMYRDRGNNLDLELSIVWVSVKKKRNFLLSDVQPIDLARRIPYSMSFRTD